MAFLLGAEVVFMVVASLRDVGVVLVFVVLVVSGVVREAGLGLVVSGVVLREEGTFNLSLILGVVVSGLILREEGTFNLRMIPIVRDERICLVGGEESEAGVILGGGEGKQRR